MQSFGFHVTQVRQHIGFILIGLNGIESATLYICISRCEITRHCLKRPCRRMKTTLQVYLLGMCAVFGHCCPSRIKCKCYSLSRLRLFAIRWTIVCEAPLSVGFSRQLAILEWVAMPSRGSSGPRNGTQVSNCRQILYHLSHVSSIGNPELLVPLYD